MKPVFAVLIAAMAAAAGSTRASAQDIASGPATVEVTVIPGGGTFFMTKNGAPSFGNYTVGGSLTYNVNRVIGIEGEVGSTLGIAQDLALGGKISSLKTPNTLDYSANLVLSAPTHASVVPYVTGGVGGLTMFERAALGIDSSDTFLTGNVGGGLKWYAPNGRWGLRGDYRFSVVRAKGDAPSFFGRDDRYGHRIYGGVIINAVR